MDLKPSGETVPGLRWRFAGAELDESTQQLSVGGVPVSLERKPLDILLCLLRHAGEVLTKDELLETVWPGRVVVEATLSVAVSKLRQALGDDEQAIVATVHGYGYRLAVPVERLSGKAAPAPNVELKEGDAVPRREHWQLQRRLGDHGDVWLAAHAKTREQRVFKFSADGERLAALKREATLSRVLRDVLGERPEFARVLEWNFEEAPYFLECEYGGVDLAEWAQAQGGLSSVSLSERIRLMAQLAEAVAAAHSAGVLHKDLKPSNVLIARDAQGQWQPRLTDFGSGRLVDPARLAELGITRMGFTQTQLNASDSSGTPLYLAPEVIGGRAPSAQSDIYALGVMLYQMVVGDLRRSLAPGWEAEIDDELLREDIAAAADGTVERRLSHAAELAARLHALDARRRERALQRESLARVRAAETELARVRARRPWLLAAALSVCAGVAVGAYFYVQELHARAQAQRQSAVAQAVNEFLNEDLLALANPQIGGKADVSVREAAQLAAASVDQRFAQAPAVAAAIYDNLGAVELQLTNYPASAAHYARAAQLYAEADGADSRAALLAEGNRIVALGNGSKLPEAQAALKVYRERLSARAADAALAAKASYAQGVLALKEAKFDEAAQAFTAARAQLLSLPQKEQGNLSSIEQAMSSMLARAGKLPEALAISQALVERLTQQKGARHPATIYARYSLGTALMLAQKNEESARVLEAAYQDAVAVLGEDHENTLHILHRLGQLYYGMERWAQSYDAMKRVHAAFERKLGARNVNTLDALNSYADAATHVGRSAEAVPLFRQGMTDATASLGDAHPLTQIMRINLAHALLDAGRAAEAAPLLDAALAQIESLRAAVPGVDGNLSYERGRLAAARGDLSAARTLYAKALEQLQPYQAPDAWLMQDVRKAQAALDRRP